MSGDSHRLADYLTHMLQAIKRIARYTERLDEVTFLQNELVQDAVIRNLEILGEASNNVLKRYPEFAAQHPELPLASAYPCATPLRMDISGSITRSSGKQSMLTFLDCQCKWKTRSPL